MEISASNLPAAVIDPRLHSAKAVAASARLVPDQAKRVAIGSAQLGYWHRRAAAPPSFAVKRLKELEHLIELRHSGPVTTDDGVVYLSFATQVAVALARETTLSRRDPETAIRNFACGWVRRWLPLVDEKAVARAIHFAMSKPRTWRADSAAKILRLTIAERTAAGIVTIGAIDADKDERARLAKERHAERQRKARASERETQGKRTRAEFEEASVAAECRRLGIARSTFYRRRRAAEAAENAGRNTSSASSKKDLGIAHATCCVPVPTAGEARGGMRALGGPGAAPTRPATPRRRSTPRPETPLTPTVVWRWWRAVHAPPSRNRRWLQ